MSSKEIHQQKWNFVCYRCGRIIKPDERMVTISVSLETPTQDNSIECVESTAVSALCFPCASVLISKAVVRDEGLMMPTIMDEETDVEEATGCGDNGNNRGILINLMSNDAVADEMLKVHCSEDGFYFTLQCSDGISQANSQLFTWRQIAQLLIAADPDMFGVLDEPLHQVFPQNLRRLGYYVPNWQDGPKKN